MPPIAKLDKRVYDLLADWRANDESDWDSGFLGLILRFLPWFEAERIEYMFVESVAIRLHGGERDGVNAALAVTPASWAHLLRTQTPGFDITDYERSGSLSVTGLRYVSPVQILNDVASARVCVHGLWVASPEFLIDEALLRPTFYTRRTVISLIRANGLDETFQKKLSTRRRRSHYLNCLAEARQGLAE